MIAIVNYGLGNVKAFDNVFKKLNIPVIIAEKTEDFEDADKIILPGVGSFDYAMTLLEKSGMKKQLIEMVINRKLPVLGVCVGMQMLGESSEEGRLPGLGWIEGRVKKLMVIGEGAGAKKLPLPHMGWNNINFSSENRLFNGLEENTRFYFLHSYYFECFDKQNSIATSNYCHDFTCAVNKENIFGVQFHPEKSHGWGVQLLKNFAEI